MKQWIRSLRVRYSLWTAGLVLLGGLVIGVPSFIAIKNQLYASLDDSLRLNASQAIDMVDIDNGNIVVSEDFDGGTLSVDLLDRGLTVRIIDKYGLNIKAVGPFQALPISSNSFATLQNGNSSFQSLVDPSSKAPIRYFVAPIIDSGQVVGGVQVVQTLTGIQATIDNIQLGFIVALIILVIFAGLVGNFLARRMLSPTEQLIRSLRQISADGLSARIDVASTDQEMDRLVITLDNLPPMPPTN